MPNGVTIYCTQNTLVGQRPNRCGDRRACDGWKDYLAERTG